jgi:acylpyruvate hydrolase
MKLVSIDTPTGDAAGALLANGDVLVLAAAALPGSTEAWIPRKLIDILAAGPEGLAMVRKVVARVDGDPAAQARLRGTGGVLPAANARLLAPIPNPSMLLAVGLAYKSHLAEMSKTPAPPHPSAFLKLPASINHPGAPIQVPPYAADHIDFEGELAVVFGRTCHQVTAAEALQYVAGYTVCNDVSARDWVHPVWDATTPWEARWTWEVNIMGKSLPGFTPLGPVLTTADEIADPHELTLETRLNGRVMQSTSTSDMIFPLAEVIAYFSRWYTFRPGDVLATGTPAGVGVGRKPPVFMKAGDVIEVEISRIGCLRNTLVAA